MTLDVLVFTLGVLVAGLLALAALPAVWRRALRLSEERLSRLVPLSAEEVAAERDHLRAAHAVEVRRIEQRLERAEAAAAALKVEAGRREGRIAALDAEAARAQVAIAALEAERAALQREAAGLWAEAGAEAVALQGLAALADRRFDEIATLQAERDALAATRDGLVHEVDRSRGSIAALETRLAGTETRNEDLERALAQARRETTEARDAAAAAARQDLAPVLERRDHEIEGLRTELAFMAEQAASAERRATEATKAAEALRRDRAAAALEPLDEQARLRGAISALADAVLNATGRAAPTPR